VVITRGQAEALDAADPLAPLRVRFRLPPGVIYLDGNSLGALPAGVAARVAHVVEQEWGTDLIRSWNTNGWWEAALRIGERLAPLLGAGPGQVAVCDSTSVNLYKLLVGALRLRPDRRVVVTEADSFPTDLYLTQSVADQLGATVRPCDPTDVAASLDDDVAVVSLTHVNYRTGAMHDLAGVTAAAHAVGALVLWDLAHSAGAVPLALDAAAADLAVGCTYKYLNGGPGSPAYVYVATRHQDALRQPLTGWHGHADPFAMAPTYQAAPGIARTLVGTPPMLSLAALEAALDAFDDVGLEELRAKSISLCELFVALVEARTAGFSLVSPREPSRRGSQVSLSHPQGYAIVQALIARGVIGDYREPGILRFGFAPLYVRHVDVWDAVEHLVAVLDRGEHEHPEHARRSAVT
jgi:kynureninase